jgi:hypothetical protein
VINVWFVKRRMLSVVVVILSCLALVVNADAASVKKKRSAKTQWKGYGFLPGYAPYEIARLRKKGYRGPIYGYGYGRSRFTYTNPPLQVYAGYPYYGGYPYEGYYGGGYYGYGSYYVGKYYYGAPGFVRGQYNGGSMGPCWTQTPIGPIWNCGS